MALEALVAYYRAFEADVPQMTTRCRWGRRPIGTAAFNGRSTTGAAGPAVDAGRWSRRSRPRRPRRCRSPAPAPAVSTTPRACSRSRPSRPRPSIAASASSGATSRIVKDGTGPATTSFSAGDLVRVTVAVTIRGEGRYLALTDPLPAGFEPHRRLVRHDRASELAREATRGNRGRRLVGVVAARRLRSRGEARRPRPRVRDAAGIGPPRVLVSRRARRLPARSGSGARGWRRCMRRSSRARVSRRRSP